jgi:hypothetical protein
MPRFHRNESSLELPPKGIYLTRTTKAQEKRSSGGNQMIALTLNSIPDGFRFFYHLVFTEACEGMVTHFCHACEGELILPDDFEQEFSLTPADCLYRLVFVAIDHEEDQNGDERATVKAILKRAKALAKAPHLAELTPPNVPPAKALPIVVDPRGKQSAAALALSNGVPQDLDAEPDDIPF